ncbi:MAG: TonB-dependent receptor plug domain-containing protein [Bacteroidota bacterium]
MVSPLRFVLVSLLFLGGVLQAQKTESINLSATYESAPLTEVLTQLEKQYGLTFSYLADAVAGKTVTHRFQAAPWAEIATFLTDRCGLRVRLLDGGYVTLTALAPADVRNWSVCFHLTDETGIPLPFVTVQLAGTPTSFYSDENGRAEQSCKAAATDSLEFSFLGYQTQRVAVGDITNCPTYRLQPGGVELSAIEVIEYLTDGVDATPDGREVLIRPNQIAALPGFTENAVYRSLELLPGINSPDESAGGINVRGGSRDQTRILWDGINVYPSGHLGGMISFFTPELVASTRVWRGQANAAYGGRLSGVVAMQTDREITDRPAAGANVNLTHGNAYLKLPLLAGKSDLHLAVRSSLGAFGDNATFASLRQQVSQTDLLQDFTAANIDTITNALNDQQEAGFREFNGRWQWNPSPRSALTLSFFHQRDNFLTTLDETNFAEVYSDEIDSQNTGMSVTWHLRLRPGSELRLRATQSSFDALSVTNIDETIFGQEVIRNSGIRERSLRLDLDHPISATDRLRTGLELQQLDNQFRFQITEDINDDIFDVDEFENDSTAALSAIAYATYGINGPGPFRADLGLRLHYYSFTDRVYPEPRLTASYALSPSWTLKAGYGHNHQFITEIIEIAPNQFGSNVPLWTLSDGFEFSVPRAHELTFGLLGQGKSWLFDLELYHKRIGNLPTLDRLPASEEDFDEDDFFSFGRSRSTGADLLLKKRWGKFRSWVIYTLSKTDWQFDDLGPGFVAASNDRRHQLKWVGTFTADRWLFSLGWRFHSGAPFTEPAIEDAIFDPELPEAVPIDFGQDFNNASLSNFHRLDFSVFYRWGKAKNQRGLGGSIGFSALNLYDRHNELGVRYQSFSEFELEDEEVPLWQEIRKFGLGFTPNLSVSVHWR